MVKQSDLFAAGTVTLLALLLHSVAAAAQTVVGKNQPTGVDLICVAEQPATVVGESTTLHAWAATLDGPLIDTPTSFQWKVDAGGVDAQAASTRWDLSAVTVEPPAVERRVIATVTASQVGRSAVSCKVEVIIGIKESTLPDRGTLSGESLISARHYLLPNTVESPGYGLYSYLLFGAPPKDAEQTARYLKTIEAYLLVLQDVDEYLSRHVRPKQLNLTYIPLKMIPKPAKSSAEWAANALAAYDYATAQILLSRVRQSHQDGPYLLSVLAPLSAPGEPAHLWEDLTGVVPVLAWDWIRYFTYLAAQQRSWSEQTLRLFGLKLRNLIAVGGKVAPSAAQVLEKAIQFEPKE